MGYCNLWARIGQDFKRTAFDVSRIPANVALTKPKVPFTAAHSNRLFRAGNMKNHYHVR